MTVPAAAEPLPPSPLAPLAPTPISTEPAAAAPRWRGVWLLAAVVLAWHIVVNVVTPYEWHRDELLYLAMGRHLTLWRMDFPPFIALVANAMRGLFGDTLWGVRLPVALSHAGLVVASATAARLLGGGRRAQALAALSIAVAPVYQRPGALFQPVAFDQLWWTLALLALLQLRRSRDVRWWYGIGAAMGLGLLTKFSIAFIGSGVVVAVLAANDRRDFLRKEPWLAFAMALAIGSPSLAGQLRLDWPIRYQMRDLQMGQLVHMTPGAFVSEQVVLLGPTVVLAVTGVLWLLVGARVRWAREVALATLTAFGVLLLAHGKAYYAAPIYPVLVGAGAAALFALRAARLQQLAVVTIGLLTLVGGAVAAPIGLPFLPPAQMARYSQVLGIAAVTQTNRGTRLPLPQDYADMLGWRELAADVALEVEKIPPAERDSIVLIADNYGQASALDFYGPAMHLPPVIAEPGSWWFFGAGTRRGAIVIKVDYADADLPQLFASCTQRNHAANPWAVEEEQRLVLWTCRDMHGSIQERWPMLDPRLPPRP